MSRIQLTSSDLPGPVMVDVAGFTLTPAERKRLQHPQVGGVILFARNFDSRAQLTALTREIHAARQTPLLIAVDQEGGRVQRFRTDGFTALPPMRALGEAWMREPMSAMRMATDVGFVLASELRACGVDFSFTPVLDLDHGVSTVVGNRSFHGDARVVAMLARAVIQGLALAGMGACGKHFPGHGYAQTDSHHAVAIDDRPLQDILAADAAPYGWLGDSILPAVMPAHVIYPSVDDNPAGFSARWLGEILRVQLGYGGVIFSDDLTMAAAAAVGGIHVRACAALDAGCDMVLVCNRPDLADELLEQLERPVAPDSQARIRSLFPVMPALDWDTLQADSRYKHARNFQSQILPG